VENKWFRAALPALLIHVSIGSVYCWTVFKKNIAETINYDLSQVEWGFSLAIFFLGMSAAFMGKFIEKNLKRSALLSLIFFNVGLIGTGLSIRFQSLWGVLFFYGFIMGIGLGIGYLTPVKNLMIWFHENKGLGTGLAVAGFGLAKVIATPLMEFLLASVGVEAMFYYLALIYGILMLIAYLIIQRPPLYEENPSWAKDKPLSRKVIIKNPVFLGIWLLFYLNITCGLAIISNEKDILSLIFPKMGITDFVGYISLILSFNAFFNTIGRIGYSSLSDKTNSRETIYILIFSSSIIACLLFWGFGSVTYGLIIPTLILMFVINAGYGGGFSTLPVLLQEHFGMNSISAVHGLALSAWAFAGLSGNQLAVLITQVLGQSFDQLALYLAGLYLIAFLATLFVQHSKKKYNLTASNTSN